MLKIQTWDTLFHFFRLLVISPWGQVSKQKEERLERVLRWRYRELKQPIVEIPSLWGDKRGAGVTLGRLSVIVRIEKSASREGR